MTVKVWLDDIRTPPSQDWIWIKNQSELMGFMVTLFALDSYIDVMSFDHDLGEDEPDGYDIIKWLSNNWPSRYPKTVLVHSANPVGAENIQKWDECWRRNAN